MLMSFIKHGRVGIKVCPKPSTLCQYKGSPPIFYLLGDGGVFRTSLNAGSGAL